MKHTKLYSKNLLLIFNTTKNKKNKYYDCCYSQRRRRHSYTLFPRRKFLAEHLIRRSTAESDVYYLRALLKSGSYSHVHLSAREFSTLLREREDTRACIVSRRHENFFVGLNYFCLTTWLRGLEMWKENNS